MTKRKYKCPRCRKKSGATILYGMPVWDLVSNDVEQGYLVIGGCMAERDDPERECTACGYQWRIKRRKPDLSDLSDPVPDWFEFKMFTAMNMDGGHVSWRDGKLVTGCTYFQQHEISLLPSEDAWSRFWFKISSDGANIWDWKRQYDNSNVLDGISWELDCSLTRIRKQSYGNNGYPGTESICWEQSRPIAVLIRELRTLVDDRSLFQF